MQHIVSVLDRNTCWLWFAVPKEVYVYIRQLEHFIKYPELSKLKEVYSERFPTPQPPKANT